MLPTERFEKVEVENHAQLRDWLGANHAHDEPSAEANFDATAPSYHRNVLRWIAMARKSQTRAKRIGERVFHAAANRKVPQM